MLVINHFPDLTGCDLDSPVPEIAMTSDQMADGMKTSAREPEFTTALMERVRQEKLTLRQLFDVISAGFWSLGVDRHPDQNCRSDGGVVHHGRGRRFHRAATGSAWLPAWISSSW